MTTNADMAAAARLYAASRLLVLPIWWPVGSRCACPLGDDCPHPGKHPLSRHGKDDATSELGVVARWWERHPEANIGIRPPAGVSVLDVDPRHQGATNLAALTRQHGTLTPTWTARTGGGGLHIWYRYGGRLRGQLCPGVDLKGHAGYVLAPPSLHAAGLRYEWISESPVAPMPGWVRKLLNPPTPPSPVAAPRITGQRDERAAAGLVRTVATAQEGGRNQALMWAACRAHERGADPRLLADIEAAACAIGLPTREIELTMKSAASTVRGAA